MKITEIVLLLGGNKGDMSDNLICALNEISAKIGDITRKSRVYESEAWGFSADPFHNQIVVCNTTLTPEQLLETIWIIEREFGRERGTKEEELAKYISRKNGEIGYSSRSMDIDILYYGDEIIQTSLLTIPHPLIFEREFVLIPLRELFPEKVK